MNKQTEIPKSHPVSQEISVAFGRYNIIVKVFGSLIDKIKERNIDDRRWFIFSEKIGQKYLTQAYTLQHFFANDIYIIQGGKEQRFFDFSSIFSLLRVQLETYAVFYHLFVDRCNMEEKIIRFRLWELDGLRSRQKYRSQDDPEVDTKIQSELKDIENCISVINQFSYFKNLVKENQDYLLKFAAWRFNDNSLKSKDKRKKRLSSDQMIMNTGLKETHFNDWYSVYSTHSHSTYWSVVQNDTVTEQEKITSEYVAIMQANFITSFFITDFLKIYEIAKSYFNSLPLQEQEIINSFNLLGRNSK